MAFTLVGWSQSQDTGGVLTYVNALADQHVRVEGQNIIVPRGMNYLGAAYAVGATVTNARIESPSLRRVVNIDLANIDVAAMPSSPYNFVPWFGNPLELDEDEGLRALVSESAAGAEQDTVLAWLTDGKLEPVAAPIYTVRASSSTTLSAYAWTNCSLSFAQTLPSGRYQVVGMHALSTGAIAARIVFVGGVWRPGCICHQSVGNRILNHFRYGYLGVWGEFEATQPPTVDFLSASADTSETVFLDLVYLGSGAAPA
jgi:hypothetical protein